MRLKAFVAWTSVLLLLVAFFTWRSGRRGPVRPLDATPRLIAQGSPVAPSALTQPLLSSRATRSIVEPLDVLWLKPVPEPKFAAFAEWTRRYLAESNPQARAQLEEEGLRLARERLTAMADMVVGDPHRALELTVPFSIRSQLPAVITDLLERPLNARGDFEVVGIVPLP